MKPINRNLINGLAPGILVAPTATPAVHSVKPLPAELPEEVWTFAEMDNDKVQPSIRLFKPKSVVINGALISKRICIGRIDSRDDAALLVRAVNNHARLVAALEKIAEMSESGVLIRHETGKPTWHASDETAKIARAALAAAKGYQP